jgi:hypothetical protein
VEANMIDWTVLEAQIGLEALPAFHRAFLVSRGVDVTGMMLRRVQQNVEREINKLVLEGKAKREDTRIWIDPGVLTDLGLNGLELSDGRSLQSLIEQLPRQA